MTSALLIQSQVSRHSPSFTHLLYPALAVRTVMMLILFNVAAEISNLITQIIVKKFRQLIEFLWLNFRSSYATRNVLKWIL